MTEQCKFKTFALTVRPRDGISDQQVSILTAFIKKRTDHHHVVTEKLGSERHVHAALYLKTAITKSNFATLLTRLCKNTLDFDETELSVVRKGIKILYNNDFVENYLDKDDDTVVISTDLPESSHLESWYPPKPVTKSKTQKHSAYYWELEKLWYELQSPTVEVHTLNARHFLYRLMYSDRVIPIIRDDKQIVQTARHLVRFINKADQSTIDLAPFEKEE